MGFAHSGTAGDVLHVQAAIGRDAAIAFTGPTRDGGLPPVEVAGSGTAERPAAPRGVFATD